MESETLRTEIKKFIQTSKDGNFSLKLIRKHLEDTFDVNLISQKDLIKDLTAEVVKEQTNQPVLIEKSEIKVEKDIPKFELPNSSAKKRKITTETSKAIFKADDAGEPYFEV
jgi:hypothetical protein